MDEVYCEKKNVNILQKRKLTSENLRKAYVSTAEKY